MSEKGKLDSALFSGTALVKRGCSYALANVGKTVAVITSIAVLLVTFGEIGFIDLGSADVTAEILVMLVASYVIYFSLHDTGEGVGRETEAFKTSEEKYLKARERLSNADVSRVRDFLTEYTAEELLFRRRAYIASRGASFSEYEKYKNAESVSPRDRRTFIRADKMRAVTLTPRDLLSKKRNEHGRELSNPTSGKALRMVLRMIPTTIGTLFTVSLMVGFKDGLTSESVIESLVRLSALPIVALRAYAHGYSFASEELISWLETKTRIIEAFFDRERQMEQKNLTTVPK